MLLEAANLQPSHSLDTGRKLLLRLFMHTVSLNNEISPLPLLPTYLCTLRWTSSGRGAMIPPGQGGAEPLNLAQVDEEGAIRAVHSVEAVTGVRGPSGSHPLGKKKIYISLAQCH